MSGVISGLSELRVQCVPRLGCLFRLDMRYVMVAMRATDDKVCLLVLFSMLILLNLLLLDEKCRLDARELETTNFINEWILQVIQSINLESSDIHIIFGL